MCFAAEKSVSRLDPAVLCVSLMNLCIFPTDGEDDSSPNRQNLSSVLDQVSRRYVSSKSRTMASSYLLHHMD